MSYGQEQYGVDSYGSNDAVLPQLAITAASPVSTNVVRVTLSREPQTTVASAAGDVLNTRTWKLVRLDSNVGFTIIQISSISETVWDVRVLEALGSSNITHQISADTLLDTVGGLITVPSAFNFAGLLDASVSTPDRLVANRQYSIRDLDNPQAALASGSSGGVYKVSNDGDYQLHGGTDFVRKMIFRRLMTAKGGFRFLPDFGVGLRVKEPLPIGNLISLQKEIEDQVKLEPEVDKVRATVTQDQNHLTVTVFARLKQTGQQLSLPLSIPFGVSF